MASILKPPLQARANSGLTFRPDANTVLWLPGQDDAYSSTIRDRSGRGNNGTIVGATWKRCSRGLWYLDYDGGDDFTDCGRDSSLDFGTADFSVGAWIKTTATATGTIISKGHARRFQAFVNASGLPVFNLDDVDNEFQITADAGDEVNDGVWHKVLGVADRDGDGIIYIDGVAVKNASCTATTTITDTGKDLTMGIYSGNLTSNPFEGGIALPITFPRVVTADEEAGNFARERHLFGV